ncbi:MAG: 7-cyano-7-deazaguanine synthase QueC [Fimbriimonadaceae bacterium]
MKYRDRRAVVLLSGGLDSATVLAVARSQGYACFALTMDYGQRHRIELEMAARQASLQGVAEHIVLPLDLRSVSPSALTADIPVPKEGVTADIPVTYVPARNTIFLSFALAWAETLGGADIFLGVNALDYSGYPDCRPEFIEAFQRLAQLATKAGVTGKTMTIHTPLIRMSKSEIIQLGIQLGVPFEWTSSCYDPAPNGRPCGACDSCRLRAKGFDEAGLSDPLTMRFLSPEGVLDGI